MKKLIPALALLLVSAVMLGTSSFAWFSMNRTVAATGMQVKATSAASLIIDDVDADLPTARLTSVGLTADTSAIAPSQLNWTNYTTTGHGYVTNPTDVDPATGLAKTGKTLTKSDITNDSSATKYYIDYTVYIASAGAAINAALVADLGTISSVSGLLDEAFTVAFYVGSVSAGNLKGTLRFNQTDASDTVELVAKATGENPTPSIPEANGSNGIKVIMRVFLDGEYEGTVGTANVNNGTVDTESVTFSVNFTAVE